MENATQTQTAYKQPFKHTCYVCGNEGFIYVGQDHYRCYRDMCVYRDYKGLATEELTKRVCYVCGRVGENHFNIGDYRGIKLYRCSNNNYCQMKLVKGVKLLYTNEGVYKYSKRNPKDVSLIMLNAEELEELKKQEIKERLEQLQDPSYKPTLIELFILSLQGKWCTIDELATKYKANLATTKSTIPYQIRKQGYIVNTKVENNVTHYKIEDKLSVEPVTKPSEIEPVTKPNSIISPALVKPKKVYVYVPKIPTSGKAFELYNLLKTGEYTVAELVEKAGVTEATVKIQINWHLKKAGVNVVKNGEKYTIKGDQV